MVKAIWAVACPTIAAGLVLLTLGGCGGAPVKPDSATDSKDDPSKVAIPYLPPDREEGSQAKSANPRGPSKLPPVAALKPSGPQYRIGVEDVLRISVWENRELSLEVAVRPDGKVSMPLIQDVQAEGLTATELSNVIRSQLLSFIKDPQVSVIITQVNAPKFYIIGSVVRPGPYPLRSDVSVLQALALSGGFTQFASPRSIKIVRGTGEKQEVRKVNFYDIIDTGGEGNYLLRSGDTIVVP